MSKWIVAAALTAMTVVVGCKNDDGKTGSATAGDKIGVAECDDYLAEMEACFAKDAATKAAMGSSMQQRRESWKQIAAQGGAAKDGLDKACAQAVETIPPTCK